jgi:polyhydroxyalkanoate synthesis regulator protein
MSSDLPPIPVYRYSTSGFYDTLARNYVPESVLLAWIAVGINFVVLDAATGEDVTRDLSPCVVTGLPERAPEMMVHTA